MPGRQYTATSHYRYGFNGKEQDSAIDGTGVDYDYGARIYDARVGRFLSLDLLQSKYAGESPYQFCGGNPIYFMDFDGKDRVTTNIFIDQRTGAKTIVKVTVYNEVTSVPVQIPTNYSHDFYYQYQWYDINQTITHYQTDGKDTKVVTGQETLGKYEGTTSFPWKWWGELNTGANHNSYGGIEFYSEDGQGGESKHTEIPVERADIGALVAAIGGIHGLGEMQTFNSLLAQIKHDKKFAEKVEAAAEFVKQIAEGIHTINETRRAIQESKDAPEVDNTKQVMRDTIVKMFPQPPNNRGAWSDSEGVAKEWLEYQRLHPKAKPAKPFYDKTKYTPLH